MKSKLTSGRSFETHGITLIEVLLIIVAVFVLIGLLTPGHRAGPKARRVQCANNLRQTALSFLIWAEDHGGKLPFQISTNQGGSLDYVHSSELYRHFQNVSNELGNAWVFYCPADKQRAPATNFADLANTNISIFLTLSAHGTNRSVVLAGDRNIAANSQNYPPGIHRIPTNQPVTWGQGLHNPGGNLVFLDGRVEQCDNQKLALRFTSTGQATNTLAFP